MDTIPLPRSFAFHGGRFLAAGPLATTGPHWVHRVADALTGSPFFPELMRANGHTVSVRVIAPEEVPDAPRDLPDSSYRLHVSRDGARIECASPSGLVAALRTLRSAATQGGYRCCTVEDRPRYAYRGMHLDVCRHYFRADFVKHLVGLMAAVGLNVFHWHLTEDQGWRLPVPAYPRLTETGAYRIGTDGSRYGCHYTEDEVREVVRFAGLHGILVIPEIEVPGHARAAIASYPYLSCEQRQLDVWTEWGVCHDVMCAGNDEVFDFLDGVFNEVARLFPSRYIHLGGDECPKTRWKACPRCQERIRAEGLADEDELQSYFVGRVARSLSALGRTALGWDEIMEGGIPADAAVMSWRGTEGGSRAALEHHDAVMTPVSHCYLNRYADRPWRDRGAPLTTETVYSFDPCTGVPAEATHRILGGQGCFWTEHIATPEEAQTRLSPRIFALAEALWTEPSRRDYRSFNRRLESGLPLLEQYGWRTGAAG